MRSPDIPSSTSHSDLANAQLEPALINRAFYEMLAQVNDDAEELMEFVAGAANHKLDA